LYTRVRLFHLVTSNASRGSFLRPSFTTTHTTDSAAIVKIAKSYSFVKNQT
jgi:hypothetical protein